MNNCLFCDKKEYVFENDLAYAIFDGFPVSEGHMLIIPKRHVVDYFSLTDEELLALKSLSNICKEYLDKEYHPDGYNIGFNCGFFAGQSIMHCHMHIIPRYNGDVINPKGGIRHIIPGKGNYGYEK